MRRTDSAREEGRKIFLNKSNEVELRPHAGGMGNIRLMVSVNAQDLLVPWRKPESVQVRNRL